MIGTEVLVDDTLSSSPATMPQARVPDAAQTIQLAYVVGALLGEVTLVIEEHRIIFVVALKHSSTSGVTPLLEPVSGVTWVTVSDELLEGDAPVSKTRRERFPVVLIELCSLLDIDNVVLRGHDLGDVVQATDQDGTPVAVPVGRWLLGRATVVHQITVVDRLLSHEALPGDQSGRAERGGCLATDESPHTRIH